MEEKKETSALDRALREKDFEKVALAIEGGKADNSLKNVELVEGLIESYKKDGTVNAPIEVIITSIILLSSREIASIIEVLKRTASVKLAEEIKEKVERGEADEKDLSMAFMLAISALGNKE